MGLAQDMFDFKNTKAIIDPITDELILVKTDENGNPTNEVVNVSQLGTLSSEQELEYNYRQEIQNRIKGSGTKKYKDKNGREVITILGAEIGSEQATKTINSLTDSILGDENQMLSILDQNGFEYTQDESLKGKDGYIYYDIKNGTYDYDKDKAREIVKNEITNSIPETVIEVKQKTPAELRREELEIEAGFKTGALTETIELYNQSAINGKDKEFRKHPDWLKPISKPPYAIIDYSFKYQSSPAYSDKTGPLMFTLGGLETLPSGEVLDKDGEIIPKLFAAGRTTAGLPRTGKGYASGMSVGDATFFGRMAGISASKPK